MTNSDAVQHTTTYHHPVDQFISEFPSPRQITWRQASSPLFRSSIRAAREHCQVENPRSTALNQIPFVYASMILWMRPSAGVCSFPPLNTFLLIIASPLAVGCRACNEPLSNSAVVYSHCFLAVPSRCAAVDPPRCDHYAKPHMST